MSRSGNLGLGGSFLEAALSDGPTGSGCSMLVYRTYAAGDRQFPPIPENTEILPQCPYFLVMRRDCRGN